MRVGIEASGYTQWFERLLEELGHELWVGDAAAIRASAVRRQKNDERDAAHILELLVENRFPRIWVPTPAERDLRQLVLHRVKLVQMRTQVMNQLHALAMGQGLCRKKKLWGPGGTAGAGRFGTGAVGRAASQRVADLDRSVEAADCRTRPRHREGSDGARGSGSTDDASGRGTADRTGLRVDGGPGRALSAQPKTERVLGAGPDDGRVGAAYAHRIHQQAGQLVSLDSADTFIDGATQKPANRGIFGGCGRCDRVHRRLAGF